MTWIKVRPGCYLLLLFFSIIFVLVAQGRIFCYSSSIIFINLLFLLLLLLRLRPIDDCNDSLAIHGVLSTSLSTRGKGIVGSRKNETQSTWRISNNKRNYIPLVYGVGYNKDKHIIILTTRQNKLYKCDFALNTLLLLATMLRIWFCYWVRLWAGCFVSKIYIM